MLKSEKITKEIASLEGKLAEADSALTAATASRKAALLAVAEGREADVDAAEAVLLKARRTAEGTELAIAAARERLAMALDAERVDRIRNANKEIAGLAKEREAIVKDAFRSLSELKQALLRSEANEGAIQGIRSRFGLHHVHNQAHLTSPSVTGWLIDGVRKQMERDCAPIGLVPFGRDLGTVAEPVFLEHALAGTAADIFQISEDAPEPLAAAEPEPVLPEPEAFDEDVARAFGLAGAGVAVDFGAVMERRQRQTAISEDDVLG